MKIEPKPIKLYVCPNCQSSRPWPEIMSQLGGKGVKNPKKANGKDYSAMGKKSALLRWGKKTDPTSKPPLQLEP